MKMLSHNYWGLCPNCKSNDSGLEYLDVGRTHWIMCHHCKVCWCLGLNIFFDWVNETEDVLQHNIELLDACEEVEPYHCLTTRLGWWWGGITSKLKSLIPNRFKAPKESDIPF